MNRSGRLCIFGVCRRPRALRSARKMARGAVALEFAILFPLIMAVFFSVVEWGFVVYNKAVLTNAAREGARMGIVLRTPAQRTSGADIAAAQARATASCQNALITMSGSGSCDVQAAPLGSRASGERFRVTVSHTYNPTGLMILYDIMNGPIVLTQRAEMIYE